MVPINRGSSCCSLVGRCGSLFLDPDSSLWIRSETSSSNIQKTSNLNCSNGEEELNPNSILQPPIQMSISSIFAISHFTNGASEGAAGHRPSPDAFLLGMPPRQAMRRYADKTLHYYWQDYRREMSSLHVRWKSRGIVNAQVAKTELESCLTLEDFVELMSASSQSSCPDVNKRRLKMSRRVDLIQRQLTQALRHVA